MIVRYERGEYFVKEGNPVGERSYSVHPGTIWKV